MATDPSPSSEGRLPGELRTFMLQSGFWAVLCFSTEAFCHFFLHLRYPYDYPAVPAFLIFGDFRFWFGKLVTTFHTREFYTTGAPLMYPAPVVVVYKFFTLFSFSQHALIATLRFVAVILATSWIMLYGFYRGLVRRGITPKSARIFLAAVYFLSFPFWFEVHQANMEFVVWVMVMLGLWAFWIRRPWAAAVFFGVAAAMKIFPLVFVGLFLTRKQYRQAAFTLVVVAFTTAVSLWLVYPDIAYSWRATNAAVGQFREMYMLHLLPTETGFDHSLFCLFKKVIPALPPPSVMSRLLTAYLAVAAVGGILLYLLRIRTMPMVNQILCLSIAAILLPPTSYDYTLLHLYAPFALVVFVAIECRSARPALPGLLLLFVLFAFLLSPQSEFIAHGLRFAGQLKAVALFLLGLAALIYRLPSKGDLDEIPATEG
jgi:hypothetical protein